MADTGAGSGGIDDGADPGKAADARLDRWRPQPAPLTDVAQGDESRTDESRTDESRTDESRTDESRTDESRTDESRTDESRTDAARTDRRLGRDGDVLPAELDASGFVGPYLFPDNRRRLVSAAIYAVTGAGAIAVWLIRATGGILVNRGLVIGGVVMVLIALYQARAAYPLAVRDLEALTAASREVGFPVGHASAQLGWRGLRSRPTWRILLYSGEDPPAKRGLVLVDAVDGTVVAHFVEDNPEDWSEYDR